MEYYNKPAMMIFPELKNHSSSIIEELKISVEKKEPVEIFGRIYSPQVKTLYQNDDVTGEVYVLVDDTEHYLYMKELEEQKNIAEAANASKSAFLSVVSHEIRTPMNAVVGMTDLLLQDKGSLDSKQEKYLTNIRNSGEALVMIVNDILDQS
ncbi:MAG: histidine kinase dimerization/phospho-acceptor domain-containing protein [Bacillota bacterium]|nr:histidine kinase dimerization/phospho-acceptor domain-containing protein [Bacillota bacterium]